MFFFQVVVIKKGTISEQGTHEELTELDGVYKQLLLRQLERGAYDDSNAENKKSESQDEDDDDKNGVGGPSIFRQISSTIMRIQGQKQRLAGVPQNSCMVESRKSLMETSMMESLFRKVEDCRPVASAKKKSKVSKVFSREFFRNFSSLYFFQNTSEHLLLDTQRCGSLISH